MDMIDDYEPIKVDGKYMSDVGFNYTRVFFYEKYFFSHKFVSELQATLKERRHWGLIIALSYILIIFSLKHYMKNRERYPLRIPLVLWNMLLASFSIMGTIRIVPEILHVYQTRGLEASVCNRDFIHGVVGHWSFTFAMSKVPELFDTLFIVLRKQPLIFLHWYHHATILIYAFYWYPEVGSNARLFGLMNYSVHSIMYTYYALRALKVKVPKVVSLMITTLQIAQMIAGLTITSYIFYLKQFDTPTKQCQTTYKDIKHSYLMYFSYFLLFSNFFIQAYFVRGRTSIKAAAKDVIKSAKDATKKTN